MASVITSPDRYAAFISYRHNPRDRQWALRIMAALESYRTPKPLLAEAFPPRIGHLFRDEDEIPASQDLSDQIKEALVHSDNLIVICSPDTPSSRWVRREIELFQEMGRSDRIFPVLIAGEPEQCFPPELLRRRISREMPDGSREETWEEIEPIAADVRPRRDESRARTERRAVLRLAAALLGCRFDDLARRDDERRKAQLRRQLGVAAALLAIAGIGGLWWWDANLRVKTQYCAGHGERWAAPFCVGELSEAEHARTTSFRFHMQGGRVLDIARVNGREAFPWDDAPGYMIRDRDRIYGAVVTRQLRAMGIRDKPIAPASPWQNGFAERLIGSIRRECLDHIIVSGEAQRKKEGRAPNHRPEKWHLQLQNIASTKTSARMSRSDAAAMVSAE